MDRKNNRTLLFLIFLLFLTVLTASCAGLAPQDGEQVEEASATPRATSTAKVFPPTFTPAPTGLPTQTATPSQVPSWTPIPTYTASVTPLAPLEESVNIITADRDNFPVLSRDLLFFQGGYVKVWERETGEVTIVGEEELFAASNVLSGPSRAGNVAAFSTSRDGTLVAMAIAREPGQFELAVYDRDTGTVVGRTPVEADDILGLALSPGGSWMTYTALVIEADPTSTPASASSATATPSPGPAEETREIHLVRAGSALQASSNTFLYECIDECTRVLWRPDGTSFVWGDGDGLWQGQPGQFSVTLVLEAYLVGLTGTTQVSDSYRPLSWSPSGGLLLVQKGLRTGSIRAVIDVENRRIENLPGSADYTGPTVGVTWLAGDTLLIARPGDEAAGLLPVGELWGAGYSGSSFYVLQNRIQFPGSFASFPYAPVELPDGRLGVAVVNVRQPNDTGENGVYLLGLGDGSILKANALPFLQVRDSLWLPDGSGVLIISGSRVLYVPADGTGIYSLRGVTGASPCCFSWVP